jgi:uncharacterized iron-regulated protein
MGQTGEMMSEPKSLRNEAAANVRMVLFVSGDASDATGFLLGLATHSILSSPGFQSPSRGIGSGDVDISEKPEISYGRIFRREVDMVLTTRALAVLVIPALLAPAAGARERGHDQSRPAEAQAAPQAEKPDPTLLLKIGNPRLKDKTMEVALGGITAADTGAAVGFDRMIRGMAGSRFVYVGETHNSLPMHEIQFQVIRALYAQSRELAIGMEMFPVTVQETLNKWSLGLLTTEEFIREVRWYVNWNLNFGFYEKIFAFAKEHRIPVYALNIPREIITKIRMGGWDSLSEDEKKFIPRAPDLANQDHRTLIRTIFEAAEIPHAMQGAGLDMVFEGLYRAQSAWDEVMAENAVRGAESEGRRIVVCAGSGHVLYNLGINRRAFEKSGQPFKTVIAIPVPGGRKPLEVSRAIADYVFGIAEESRPAFPSIGLSFKKVEDLANLVIESKPIDGAASRADFEKGDIVLTVDGKGYDDINELRIELAKLKCGDEARFRLLRGAQVKETVLKLDKCPPAAPAEKKEAEAPALRRNRP